MKTDEQRYADDTDFVAKKFAEICELDPRIKRLHERIPEIFRAPYTPEETGCVDPFEWRWVNSVKHPMEKIVGWYADEPVALPDGAYEIVTRVFRDLAECNEPEYPDAA